jgi:hypothetical protein
MEVEFLKTFSRNEQNLRLTKKHSKTLGFHTRYEMVESLCWMAFWKTVKGPNGLA